MKRVEKKYRVESFEHVLDCLNKAGAPIVKRVTSTHYYGEHDGNDVEKFVVYPDRTEIHVLKEKDGTYAFIESKQISGKEEGLMWLKHKGYTRANIVDMNYTEYAYKNGTVGLYNIDNYLYSVVLDFVEGEHKGIENDLGLDTSKVIRQPYNLYLKEKGKIRVVDLLGFLPK